MKRNLTVMYQNQIVGNIYETEDNRMVFEYAPSWKESSKAFPLSASLPLDGGWTRGREDNHWFANLLPEGSAREALCRSLGIGVENDAALLECIGGDCAGIVRIVPENPEKKAAGTFEYQPVSSEDLKQLHQSRIPFRRASGMGLIRLSLAGAQNKWPIKWDGKQIFLPLGESPSTHIIKFPGQDFPGLAYNEAFTTAVAGSCGLPVVDSRPFGEWLISTRYDRIADGNSIRRIHQEDFCQALGYSSRLKYQKEGGPSLKDCADLIRRSHERPAADLILLIRWQIFNLLAGNADGHAKNISRLFDTPGGRLAPFYDLVCTAAYEGISPLMAMKIGNQDNPGQICTKDWTTMARDCNVHPRLVFRELDRILSALKSNLNDTAHKSVTAWGEKSAEPVQRVMNVIHKRLRRTETLLGT